MRYPLSVRQISVRRLGARIVGTATIVNTGSTPVRRTASTLGLLGPTSHDLTGVAVVSVPSLRPRASATVRFATRPVRDLPLGAGTYRVLVCTDIYSQVERFVQNAHCARGNALAIATGRLAAGAAAKPNTIISERPAVVSRSATAALRFASTIRAATFQCRLDAGPWLICGGAKRYNALVDGLHAFDVRAISSSGATDPTPAHASWNVDSLLPIVTLQTPISGSRTKDHRPAFAGAAGAAPGDSSTVEINVFSGAHVSGLPVQTGSATVSGTGWSASASRPLPDGSYTVQAEQSDAAGNTAVSLPSTFTIDSTPASQGTDLAAGGDGSPAPPTHAVSGTVSGSSGTLVLQDNGGDDLSLSGDGPFTFATQLPQDAGYNVTVKSAPAGQACGVSGGAGTVGSSNVTGVAVTCSASGPASGQDDFNRADGDLGPGWTPKGDGGLSIASQQGVGVAGALAGDIRSGETYGSNQFSRIEVTSTQLTGGDWMGPAVRSQNGGQDTYLGMYFWNHGDPQLRLYKRTGGTWTQLGASYESGPLAAGTQLTLSAVGSRISLQQDGTERIAVTDSTITGGAPGLMTFDSAMADNWSGGTPTMHSLGGTVSGLSGTLVLQDNGGDDLTLTSDGAFKFATGLPSGTAYAVTFKSAPAGESCSVSAGAGTVGSGDVTGVAVTCSASGPVLGQDDFNRADGDLGPGWAAMSDGGLSIASQQVAGTAGALAGDIRSGASYGSDQFSQIEVTSTQLTGGQWVGPAVRSQNGGQDSYTAIYFWNYGNPRLRIYKRTGGQWTQLGGSYASGPLAAGTQLTLSAVGSRISLQEDGTVRLVVTDGALTGGAPGLMTFGTATADNWSGGTLAMYSVGGTVSGLTGTVVLQDNGGDDLTLTGDGTFQFATELPQGAPYDITFKSAPGGESCSVSGGDGTVGSGDVTGVAVTCSASGPVLGQDDFNRADGDLGSGWAPMSDGGLSIASQQVVGTADALAGDIRSGESYGSDQFSQIEVTSTQLTGGQWVGPVVRSQNGGQDSYLGSYFWNYGNPQLRIYKRVGGQWTQLGDSYDSGPLSAGALLTLSAAGSRISLLQDGTERVVVNDTTITGGAPGVMTFDTAAADNWSGGTPPLHSVGGTVSGLSGTLVLQDNGGDDLTVNADGTFQFATGLAQGAGYDVTVKSAPAGQTCTVSGGIGTLGTSDVATVTITCTGGSSPPPGGPLTVQSSSTDANGVTSYQFTSSDDGYGAQTLRVLAPTHPAAGVPHNFLFVLPVEPGLGSQYGDGIDVLRSVDAEDVYNLTIIEPTFAIDPWYADNPNDPNVQYDTFMADDLVPWVRHNLTATGHEENWLIGFSKSGIGATDLILRHPDVFTLAAAWDFPADMGSFNDFGPSSAANYGTDANYQANYRLSTLFLNTHNMPFLTQNRIWIGGYNVFGTDIADLDAGLTSASILHTTEVPQLMAHRWDSGWVPIALAALHQDAAALGSS